MSIINSKIRYEKFSMIALLISLFLFSCRYFEEPVEEAVSAKESKTYSLSIEKVTGIGRVEPESKIIQIYPKTNGIIESAPVEMGDKVKKGQVLFVLENNRTAAEQALIHAKMKEQEATIKHLQVNLQKAATGAQNLEKTYRRIKQVYDQGLETKQNLDDAQTAWELANHDLTAMKAQLEIAQARLNTINKELGILQIEKEQFVLKAPSDGILLEVYTSAGAMAAKNTPLAKFAPKSPTSVVTEIDELFAKRVQIGQGAIIRLTGSRDTIAFGQVVELSPSLRRKSLFSEEIGQLEDRRVRMARIRLNKGQENVLYGQRVECLINLQSPTKQS